MPNEAQDLTGKTFGYLKVESFSHKHKDTHLRMWLCTCVCGKNVFQSTSSLNGGTKSCGCKTSQLKSVGHIKHGGSRRAEYNVWQAMRQRCQNPRCKSYKNYGGRGIRVCERWDESFRNFLTDMGDRPAKNLSLERKDNDGHYSPENCCWATRAAQANNMRKSRVFALCGEKITLAQISRKTGIKYTTLRQRLLTMTIEESILTPLKRTLQTRRASTSNLDSEWPPVTGNPPSISVKVNS